MTYLSLDWQKHIYQILVNEADSGIFFNILPKSTSVSKRISNLPSLGVRKTFTKITLELKEPFSLWFYFNIWLHAFLPFDPGACYQYGSTIRAQSVRYQHNISTTVQVQIQIENTNTYNYQGTICTISVQRCKYKQK